MNTRELLVWLAVIGGLVWLLTQASSCTREAQRLQHQRDAQASRLEHERQVECIRQRVYCGRGAP